jgi:hypothetical protein
VYCPRSVSRHCPRSVSRHDTSQTEDESNDIFSLNCISASNSVTRLFSLKITQQGRNMWEIFTNTDCVYCGALVGDKYINICPT